MGDDVVDDELLFSILDQACELLALIPRNNEDERVLSIMNEEWSVYSIFILYNT